MQIKLCVPLVIRKDLLNIPHLPTAGIGGSFVLLRWPCSGCGAELPQGQESLTVVSLSCLMFSSLIVTPPPWPTLVLIWSPTPARCPPMGTVESTMGPSSCVRSPKLPPLCRAISTPLSLLLALLRGDGSLLHDEWPPGLDWYVWWRTAGREVCEWEESNKLYEPYCRVWV